MATLIRIENSERGRERSAMIKARKLQFTILIAEQRGERTEGSGGAEKGSHKASTDHRSRLWVSKLGCVELHVFTEHQG